MKVRENDKQIVMEYTTREKHAYILGDYKYDIVYSVRLETINNYEGVEIVGCRIFNDSIFIDSGLECKRKNQKQLDKLTSELTIDNFKVGLKYLRQNIINMSKFGLSEEDKDNIAFIDRCLENDNLESVVEY